MQEVLEGNGKKDSEEGTVMRKRVANFEPDTKIADLKLGEDDLHPEGFGARCHPFLHVRGA